MNIRMEVDRIDIEKIILEVMCKKHNLDKNNLQLEWLIVDKEVGMVTIKNTADMADEREWLNVEDL